MTFQFMLAPMDRVTDAPFRTLYYKKGADLTFTEIARVSNLARRKKPELKRIRIPDDTPTQIQLTGSRTGDYATFLADFNPEGGFRGFNLNLGCSSPDFLRNGAGAAMIKRVSRVDEIVRLIIAAGYECSIKMRLGLNDYEKEKGAYLNIIEQVPASFFVVHARTAKQTLDDPVDTSVYAKCVDTGKRIVANGDIKLPRQVEELKSAGLYGAMIGRAAIGNPDIFRVLRGLD
jgi:tRNA-dihydrouridine synthase B